MKPSRRSVATAILFATYLLTGLGNSSPGALANTSPSEPPPKAYRLRLFNTHTYEHLDIVYRFDDAYVPEALAELEHHLRDHRTGEETGFDPKLFDLLHDLAGAAGRPEAEFHVISGYRSPETNASLRRQKKGVAEHSLHMKAQAIDIRLPEMASRRLRDVALKLERGGVGYYSRSNFIHVDTGRVRRW